MQTDSDNDIPMQRNACMDFIGKQPDWEFSHEYMVLKKVLKIVGFFNRFSVMLLAKNLIFCLCLCLTDWGVRMMKRRSLSSGL